MEERKTLEEACYTQFGAPLSILRGTYRAVTGTGIDHSSRLENPHMEVLTEREIADEFSDKHLMALKSKSNNDEPWFFSQDKTYCWEVPYAFKLCADNIMRKCVARSETLEILAHCHSGPTGGHHSANVTAKKVYESGFYRPSIFKDANEYVEVQALPTNDVCVVVKFLRSLFARFGVPKALISDRGTHFCNSQLEKALQRYGVTHKLSIAYHPQSNGQTEVTNRAIKRILERSVGYNHKGKGIRPNPYGYPLCNLILQKITCNLRLQFMVLEMWYLGSGNGGGSVVIRGGMARYGGV
ncbi:reverse transcriptase domain-containing protein [Tanacetum coccineum]